MAQSSRESHLLREIEALLDTDDVSKLQSGIQKILGAYQKQARRMEKILAQSDRQQEQLLDMNEKLEDSNEKIQEAQHQAEEALSEVSALLDNSGEGFLSFDESLSVHPRYSRECRRLFGGDITGLFIGSLLYPDSPKDQNLLRKTLQVVFASADSFQAEMLLSLLPQEIYIGERWLACRFRLMQDDRMMLVLSDVTEQKELNEKVHEEKQRLLLIVNATRNRNELLEVVREFKGFADQGKAQLLHADISLEDKLKELYRMVHTFKGNFAQIHFHHLPRMLHILEGELAQLQEENIGSASLEHLCDAHLQACMETLDKDLCNITEVLGNEFVDPQKSYHISEEELREVELRFLPMVYSEEAHIALDEENMRSFNLFRLLRYKPMHELLDAYSDYAHELAHQLGKELHPFKVKGGRFKIDPERYGMFCKTLIHLFRNAVDHGIETPDERLDAGKEEQGRLACQIDGQNGWIMISISDDGRGIDAEKLLAKANHLGIICQDDPSRLIFEDGFSTKEQVSALSGRGVGLSAVKAECKKLGGYIDIETTIGQGTVFHFFLPE